MASPTPARLAPASPPAQPTTQVAPLVEPLTPPLLLRQNHFQDPAPALRYRERTGANGARPSTCTRDDPVAFSEEVTPDPAVQYGAQQPPNLNEIPERPGFAETVSVI